MCGPAAAVMAVGAAMSMASVAANASAASEQKAARNKVIFDENNRQRQIMDRSRQVFDQTLPLAGMDQQKAALDAQQGQRQTQDTAMLNDGSAPGPVVSGNVPDEVKSSVARGMRNALSAGQDLARRHAAFGAYSDVNQGTGTQLNRAGQWQTIFGNEAQRSAGITPLELEDADSAGGGARLVGGILGGLGKAGLSYGMGGMGGSAGGPYADVGSLITAKGLG